MTATGRITATILLNIAELIDCMPALAAELHIILTMLSVNCLLSTSE